MADIIDLEEYRKEQAVLRAIAAGYQRIGRAYLEQMTRDLDAILDEYTETVDRR